MRLLTAREAAPILRVTRERVYELVRLGLIPSVRLGRQVRFSESALEDWIAGGGSKENVTPLPGSEERCRLT
jgi:excisionase family DNA binding protein